MTRPDQVAERVRELRRLLRKSWYLLAVSFVTAFLAAGSAMVYANKVAHESERQWCGLVVTLDDAYADTPPQSPTGRKVARDIARLRQEFGCPPR